MRPLTLSSYRWSCNRCEACGEVAGETIAGLIADITTAHREATPECQGEALEVWPLIVQEEANGLQVPL